MTHIIYIYFIVNSFIAGYTFKDTYGWENTKKTVLYTFFAFLFGCIFYTFLFIIYSLTPILGWTYREIKFQYKFYFTKYWDRILLDCSYSTKFKTLEEKLKRANETTKNGSKQIIRHNKQVQNKYGSKERKNRVDISR